MMKKMTKKNYLKLIKEIDSEKYDKLQLEEFIFEFLSVKSGLESTLKIIEIIDVSLSISLITTVISFSDFHMLQSIFIILVFSMIQLFVSIIFIKNLMLKIEYLNRIIEKYKDKIDKIKKKNRK